MEMPEAKAVRVTKKHGCSFKSMQCIHSRIHTPLFGYLCKDHPIDAGMSEDDDDKDGGPRTLHHDSVRRRLN